jgi:glycerol-3-phosphate acyltransferase PlsY
LRFRGGKGAATSLGALLVFDYRIALTFAVLFLAGFAVMRKTVFPGMFAFACLPLASLWFNRDGLTATLVAVLSAIILLAHRRNLAEEIVALLARRGVMPKPEPPKL